MTAAKRGSRSRRYCGRFAPSPTGPLHFGSLVAALASCCDAKAASGRFLLRIEDVDLPRTVRGAEAAILGGLERAGFEWDGAILRQSERTAAYAAALSRLRERGLVYACACTRRELAVAPAGVDGERIYPGTCRSGVPAARSARTERSWRLRLDTADRALDPVRWSDRVQGAQVQDLAREVGDFIVCRADGIHAYQLAVVVDDAAQGITDVVRGADLIASTARQILLQRSLGLATPSYLHVPVAVDAAGEKLSKQTRAKAIAGDPLPSLVAAWRFLGQRCPRGSAAPVSVREFWEMAASAWSVERIPARRTIPAPGSDAPV